MSAYLSYVFRRIAQLPPDMNPLEANLTSRRRRTKHKYKNSDLSFASSEPTLPDLGRPSSLQRHKNPSSPLKHQSTTEVRAVRSMQQGADPNSGFFAQSPQTMKSVRSGRATPQSPSLHQQPLSALQSHIDEDGDEHVYLEPPKYYAGRAYDTVDGFEISPYAFTGREPRVSSLSSSIYTQPLPREAAFVPEVPRKSSKRHSLTSDNWFVHDAGSAKENEEATIVVREAEAEDTLLYHARDPSRPPKQLRQAYSPLPRYQVKELPAWPPRHSASTESFMPDALGMNPPTPPPQRDPHYQDIRAPRSTAPLADTSGNVQQQMASSKRSNGAAKAKYYGGLTAAMQAIRGVNVSPGESPSRSSPLALHHDKVRSTADGGQRGRVVSRSGVDDTGDLGVGAFFGLV